MNEITAPSNLVVVKRCEMNNFTLLYFYFIFWHNFTSPLIAIQQQTVLRAASLSHDIKFQGLSKGLSLSNDPASGSALAVAISQFQ